MTELNKNKVIYDKQMQKRNVKKILKFSVWLKDDDEDSGR